MATTAARQKISPSGATHPAIATGVAEKISDSNVSKPAGYGLPCANCHLYYPADLDTCPTCHHRERVSPLVKPPRKQAASLPLATADTASIEQEREEFLRQFKSQMVQVHAEIAEAQENGSLCALSEHHAGEEASAEICKTCYEHLHQRIDSFEAALHMDLREAAQVIYDAVWADPSDPSRTYENAAAALLSELRKRAGMIADHNPFEPLTD